MDAELDHDDLRRTGRAFRGFDLRAAVRPAVRRRNRCHPDPGGARPAADAGFTLIELLIAVAVLAVLAVGAGLAAGRGAAADVGDATAFRAAWKQAADLAVTGQSPRGLRITARGFAPVRFGADGWQAPGPQRRWQGRAVFAPGPAPASAPGTPDIVFLPNGQSSAFALTLRARAGGAARRCASDGWTGLRCDG